MVADEQGRLFFAAIAAGAKDYTYALASPQDMARAALARTDRIRRASVRDGVKDVAVEALSGN